MKKLISILAIFSMLFCCSVMSCSFAAEEVMQEESLEMNTDVMEQASENECAVDGQQKYCYCKFLKRLTNWSIGLLISLLISRVLLAGPQGEIDALALGQMIYNRAEIIAALA